MLHCRFFALPVIATGLAAALLFAACGGGGGGKPTGIHAVDTVIQNVESQDLPALSASVKYFQEPCSANPRVDIVTLYAPPRCPQGTATGTPVDVIIGLDCNPGPVLRTDAEQELQRNVTQAKHTVFAVVGPASISHWNFDYMLLIAPVGQPNAASSTIVGVRDGGVAAAVAWCGSVADAVSAFTAGGGKVIYKASTLDLSGSQ